MITLYITQWQREHSSSNDVCCLNRTAFTQANWTNWSRCL